MTEKNLEKPFWRSKKCVMYIFTGGLLITVAALKAPSTVSEYLAGALALGLPVLLGMQGWADARGVAVLSSKQQTKEEPRGS